MKDQVRSELKQVSRFIRPYPKRYKTEIVPNNARKFESTLIRIRNKWNQSLDAVFRTVEDTGAYDKLAYDLTSSFHDFYLKYQFDGDQLSFAFRCLIIPITGQIMDESDIGRRATERQTRRKYLLNKILSYGIQEMEMRQPRQETPSLDGSVDVCSESPRQSHGIERILNQIESNHPKYLIPTPITLIVIDILVEALFRLAKGIATHEASSLKHRIYHVMNITHAVQIVSDFLDWIKLKTEDDGEMSQALEKLNYDLLKSSLDRYKKLLFEASESLEISHPSSVFKLQLDLLLIQVIDTKARVK